MPAKVLSCTPAKVLVTCACVVSINGAFAVTSTVVLVWPSASLMDPNPVSRPAVTNTPFCRAELKLGAEISILYSPVGIRLKRNSPLLSVVVVNTVPVAVLVAFTVAPEITAPSGSLAVPEMDPLSSWADNEMLNATIKHVMSATTWRLLKCILFSYRYSRDKKKQKKTPSSYIIFLF